MGWVKIDRSITEHWLWDDSKEPFDKRSAWIDLLLMANHRDFKAQRRGKIIVRKRGEVNTSTTHLADRWHWSRGKVLRYLKLLESDGMITINGTADGTTLTIENYAKWQDAVTADGTTNGTTDGTAHDTTDGTAGGTTDGTHDKKGKNNKNIKNYNITPLTPLTGGKESGTDPVAERGFSPELTEAVNEWLEYKREKRQPYKSRGLAGILTTVGEKAKHYGDRAVIDLIHESMGNNYQGIAWGQIGRGQHGYTGNFGQHDEHGSDGVGAEPDGYERIFGVPGTSGG